MTITEQRDAVQELLANQLRANGVAVNEAVARDLANNLVQAFRIEERADEE